MTDQLEGAELELAGAKVMRMRAKIIQTCDGPKCVYAHPQSGLYYAWAPLTNLAQRMKVHDWVRAHEYVVTYGLGYVEFLKEGSFYVVAIGRGPDDAHALLRAVVEMGVSDG